MAKRTKQRKDSVLPSEEAMRAWVNRFVEAVNDPDFLVQFKHFEAAERAALAQRDAEAQRLEELQTEERRLAERLEAVRSSLSAAHERCGRDGQS